MAARWRARCSSFNGATAENSTATAGRCRPHPAPAGAPRSALAALGDRQKVGERRNHQRDTGAQPQQIALGFYELFIDPGLKLPEWLQFRTFDDLKLKLVGVVVVVLAVLFLGHVVGWNGERDLLRLGAGIALVIAALTYFLSISKGGKG